MTYDISTARPYQTDSGEFENIDRILLGACAALWLGALGAAVAATVALVDMGRGHPAPAGETGTPWVLYAIIVVSALVIIGSVPLLLRARRTAAAAAEPNGAPRMPSPPGGIETPTGRIRWVGRPEEVIRRAAGAGRRQALPVAAIERLNLRCALAIGSAMGAATIAVAVAAYLLAVESDLGAWISLGVAGVITVAMPAIPIAGLRRLHELLA